MAAAGRGLGSSSGHPRVPIHMYVYYTYLGHACGCNDFTALHASNVLCKPQKIPEYRECPIRLMELMKLQCLMAMLCCICMKYVFHLKKPFAFHFVQAQCSILLFSLSYIYPINRSDYQIKIFILKVQLFLY